jgi:hypothetical protein
MYLYTTFHTGTRVHFEYRARNEAKDSSQVRWFSYRKTQRQQGVQKWVTIWLLYVNLRFIIIFNLRTAAFKTYCAIWVRRSNLRHQATPSVSPRESTQRRKVELWAKNVRVFCLNAKWHVTFRDLLHAVKLRHGTDGFTSPPKKGVLRIFFPPKNPTASAGFEPANFEYQRPARYL